MHTDYYIKGRRKGTLTGCVSGSELVQTYGRWVGVVLYMMITNIPQTTAMPVCSHLYIGRPAAFHTINYAPIYWSSFITAGLLEWWLLRHSEL